MQSVNIEIMLELEIEYQNSESSCRPRLGI